MQFHTLVAASTKLSISLDAINNEIDVDVVETNINHDSLAGYVANEHIDCTSVTFSTGTGLTGGSNICSGTTLALDADIDNLNDVDTTTSAPSTNDVLTWDGSNWVPAVAPGAGGGEANIASNLGGGINVFKQKIGVDLQFHTLVAASTKLSISLDAIDNEIDVDVVETNINHDSLSGFVANEHVDCSSVILTAGTGLSGGGDICSSRTFDWSASINDLSDVDTVTTTPSTNDVLTWTGTEWEPAPAPGAGGGESNTGSNQNTGGFGVFIQKTGVDLEFKGIAAASSRVLVTNDMINNKIDIEVAEGNVNHNALAMYVANEHVDCSTVVLTAGTGLTGGGDICFSRTFDLSASINDLSDVDTVTTTPSTNDVLTWTGTEWEPAPAPGTGGGEPNIASNLGTGQGLFSAKVGVDLQFFSLSAGSTKLSIASPSMGNVELDVVSGNINHDDLGAIPANDHIDHSAVTLTGSNGITIDGGVSGDITTSRTIALSATLSQINDVDNALSPSNDQILAFDSTSMTWKAGDKVDGANIGTVGADVFSAKVADVLQFRRLQSTDTAISITQNTDNVDFVINDGAINHNALTNFVGNEHINHSTVSITGAGTGYITGGGDLTASRTLDISTTLIQRRVSGTCVSGAMTTINQDGTVVCSSSFGAGDVVGGASSSDNAIARYDGTTGKLIQNSGVTISDTGAMAGATTYNGVDIDGVQILGGVGLSNTGTATLETDVTIDLDIGSLPTLGAGTVDFSNDQVLVYDNSEGTHHRMPFTDLPLFEKAPLGEIYYFDISGSDYTITMTIPSTNGINNMFEIAPTGASGTTTLNTIANRNFDSPATGRLRYIGTGQVQCHTATSVSFYAGSNNEQIILGTAVNGGAVQENSRVVFRIAGNSPQSTALHTLVTLGQNEYFSTWIGGLDTVSTVAELVSLNMVAMCMRIP